MWNEWRFIGASQRGLSHVVDNIPNQDSWICAHTSGASVVAMSDGVGSCKNAQHGSKATCVGFVRSAIETFDARDGSEETICPNVVDFLCSVALHRADVLDGRLYDTDSTGLAAIFFGDDCLLAQLGDGVIIAIDGDGDIVSLLRDEKNDGFVNEVRGFGGSLITKGWRFTLLHGVSLKAVLLCTDGIEMETTEDYRRLSYDIYKECMNNNDEDVERELRDMLRDWPHRANHDDKTIAFAYRR